MRAVFVALALALSITTANAFARGSGGLSFDCSAGDAGDGQCVCEPPADSEDCKKMAGYCDGPITCGWGISNCWCNEKTINFSVLSGKRIKRFGGIKSPGKVANPGLLEGGGGFGPQGPAATGRPMAPAAPSSGPLR